MRKLRLPSHLKKKKSPYKPIPISDETWEFAPIVWGKIARWTKATEGQLEFGGLGVRNGHRIEDIHLACTWITPFHVHMGQEYANVMSALLREHSLSEITVHWHYHVGSAFPSTEDRRDIEARAKNMEWVDIIFGPGLDANVFISKEDTIRQAKHVIWRLPGNVLDEMNKLKEAENEGIREIQKAVGPEEITGGNRNWRWAYRKFGRFRPKQTWGGADLWKDSGIRWG